MLSFSQFLQMQQAFMPPAQRSVATASSPDAIFNQSINGISHQRDRMEFKDGDGVNWKIEWAYALPLKDQR